MEIKEYRISECIDKILDIGNSSFRHFYSKEKIFERLNGRQYWIFLLEEVGTATGFEISYPENKDTYLWLMGVRPNYQRKGLGSKLIDLQVEASRREGHLKIIIKTHKGHPEAMNLYKKKGFIEIRRESNHWGKGMDAIFFEKIIHKQHKLF